MIKVASLASGSEFVFAQRVVDMLHGMFPGWQWAACVDGGVLYIKNLSLSAKWGMQKAVDRVDKAWVIKAGGEFLERFGMPAKFDAQRVAEAKRDFTGAAVSEKWTPDRRYQNRYTKEWKA